MTGEKFLERYIKLFEDNDYVYIDLNDLDLDYRINVAIKEYNDSDASSRRIKKNFSVEKMLKILNCADENDTQSDKLMTLIYFREYCKTFGLLKPVKIRNHIFKFIKREFSKTAKIKVMHKSGIIYNSSKVRMRQIDTISEFLKEVKNIESMCAGKNIFYRGQSDLNNKVQPSVFREKNWIENETEIINEMIVNSAYDFADTHTTLEKLVKMQHYGAPTRVLDLTENPLIALYFACESPKNSTGKSCGEVLLFEAENDNCFEKYFNSDTVSIISNISMMKSDFNTGNESLLAEQFCGQADIPYLLHQIRLEKNSFLPAINYLDLHSCVIVHVKRENKRIINQQGLFLLVGMGKKRTAPADIKEAMKIKEYGRRVVFAIENNAKKNILKELDRLNINKKFIYPELDNVAEYLKNEVYKSK